MDAVSSRSESSLDPRDPGLTRIAVGVDGFPEGNDAVVLGMALSRATNAELMLVAVHSDPVLLPPFGVSWKNLRKDAQDMLRKARNALAPNARITVETDLSVPRALQRVVRREHHDLLVMGSSRHAPEGTVRIGKRTRQLLCQFECPLAVAPRGLHEHPDLRFKSIGVGFDGGAESQAALALAGAIAVAAGAELIVQTVVDDRVSPSGWSGVEATGSDSEHWEQAVTAETGRKRSEAATALQATGASGRSEIKRGRPAAALVELSRAVDLVVIGSRRWGPVARLLLGSTGESLLHDGACSVLVVPRPPD